MSPYKRSYWTAIEAASLVLGPLLMSSGDLIHPKERMDAAVASCSERRDSRDGPPTAE
jgi:hypothetical protein